MNRDRAPGAAACHLSGHATGAGLGDLPAPTNTRTALSLHVSTARGAGHPLA